MVNSTYARIAPIASAVFGCTALWRAGLAVRHYRASLNIIDDPSIRELEEVSAFFELGIAIVLLGHAVVAACQPSRSEKNEVTIAQVVRRVCHRPGRDSVFRIREFTEKRSATLVRHGL